MSSGGFRRPSLYLHFLPDTDMTVLVPADSARLASGMQVPTTRSQEQTVTAPWTYKTLCEPHQTTPQSLR